MQSKDLSTIGMIEGDHLELMHVSPTLEKETLGGENAQATEEEGMKISSQPKKRSMV